MVNFAYFLQSEIWYKVYSKSENLIKLLQANLDHNAIFLLMEFTNLVNYPT